MSIIVSPQLNNLLFVLIGEKMLQADEDLAYRSHQPYRRLGKNVRELSDLIEQSVFGVGQALPPQVGRQYVRAMRLFVDDGGTNYLREFARQLDDVGNGRVKISMDIMEAKWSIIAELVRLLIELAIITALSFFTGGASASQTATAKARSRVAILASLDQLLKRTHLLPSLSEAFDEAFQTFVVRLAMMTMAPPGRRPDGFDWKQIVEDGLFGAVTGMFHGAFESLTKNLGKGFRNILDGPDGAQFGKTNTKNITDDITSKIDKPPRSVGDRFVRETGSGANEFLVAGGSEALAEIVVTGVLHGKWEGNLDTFIGAGVSSVVGSALFGAAAKFGGAFGSGFDFGSVNVLPVTGEDGAPADGRNTGRDDDRAPEAVPTTSSTGPTRKGTTDLSTSVNTPLGVDAGLGEGRGEALGEGLDGVGPVGGMGGGGAGTVPTSSSGGTPATSGSGTPRGGGSGRSAPPPGALQGSDESEGVQEDPAASVTDEDASRATDDGADTTAPRTGTNGQGADSGPRSATTRESAFQESAFRGADEETSAGSEGAIPTIGTAGAAPLAASTTGAPANLASNAGAPAHTGSAQGQTPAQGNQASGTGSPQRANKGAPDATDPGSADGSPPESSAESASRPGTSSTATLLPGDGGSGTDAGAGPGTDVVSNAGTDVLSDARSGIAQGPGADPATAPPTTGTEGRDTARSAGPAPEPSRTAQPPVRPGAEKRRPSDGDPDAAPTPVSTRSEGSSPTTGTGENPTPDTVASPTPDTVASPTPTTSAATNPGTEPAPAIPTVTTSAPARPDPATPTATKSAPTVPTVTASVPAEPGPATPVATMSVTERRGWDEARSVVPPVTRSHTWTDPVSTPRTAEGKPTRYTVDSSFDVRRFTHDGEAVVDLTVEIALGGADTVGDTERQALWDRMAAGVRQTFNDPGHRLATGERLHVTVVPAIAGRQPHLAVELTGGGSGSRTSQHTWRTDATAQDLAHEIGHQLGLRDENRDATAPQRPQVDGSLMGTYQRPVAEGSPEEQRGSYAPGGLRPRHLSLLSALVGGPDDTVGSMPAATRSEGADPLAPLAPSPYVRSYGSRRDGNVGLVQVEPLPPRIAEGLHQHVMNLLRIPADQQATHPVVEQLRRELGGEQLVINLPYLLSSMGHRVTVDIGGRRRTVDVRLSLHDPVSSLRQGTRDPSDPAVNVERRGLGTQESGDTESSGTIRTLLVPWSATLPIPAAGPVRGVDFGPSLSLTHNQLSLSTSVTQTVQTTTAQRSNESSHAFSYESNWQARVDTPRMAPVDNWGPGSELGPVTIWFPEHLTAERPAGAEPLPEPADLDDLPLWGVDSVKEPHQLLEMVNGEFHGDLADLSDSSAQALQAFLSEPVLRGTLPMQRAGGIFSPLLLDSRGRAIGMLKLTTKVTPGKPTHQSQDGKINLESHLLNTVKVDGQAKVTNAVGVDLGVGPAFTGSHAKGHPDAAGKVAGSVLGKGGVRWQTSDTLGNGGSATISHSLRSSRSHLLTPASVRHTVTLVRPGGGETARGFGPWDDGMQLRVPARSDAAGKVPEGDELRSLPAELEHLRSIGTTAAPLTVEGPEQLFAHAEVWLRETGFLPASATTTSRTTVLPDEALVQAQLNNLRRFEQARSAVGLRAAVDAMVDGGHALWLEKPTTGGGTRRIRLNLRATRDTTPGPVDPAPDTAPVTETPDTTPAPAAPRPTRHVRTLPGLHLVGLTSFVMSGVEQQSSGYGWTAGFGGSVSGPVGPPGGSGTLGTAADYAYTSQTSHAGNAGSGLGQDQQFVGVNQGGEVFDIPARFSLDLHDGSGTGPTVRFAEHTAATPYAGPDATPTPAGPPPTAVTGSIRVAVPHHRTLPATPEPAPRPRNGQIREVTEEDRKALATTGPDGRPLEGIAKLPDDAVLDVFHGSGALQEAVRQIAAGTHPGRPQPGWATALGTAISGMSPEVVTSAASLVATSAAGQSATDPTTLAAEVRQAALSPGNLTARGHQILKGSYVIEGVTLPGLGADQEYSLEISGVLRNPRLMRSAEQQLESGVSSSDTASQQKSASATHQSGVAVTGTRASAVAKPTDPSAAPPKRPDTFGPSAKYLHTAKSEDSATLSTTTAVNRNPTEKAEIHRIGADALILVTVRGGTRNVVGNTLGLGSGEPVTVAVELPDAVQFLMTDGQLARHQEWFTGVVGLTPPQQVPQDLPLPGRFARTGEPGLAGVLSVTQLDTPRGGPEAERAESGPVAADTTASPPSGVPEGPPPASSTSEDGTASPGTPADPADPVPVERRNRLYDELIALVESEAPGVTRPGHAAYLPGVASRIADYTSPTGLRALPGRGPRGVQRFHFRHLAKGGARLVEVTLNARPRAGAEERRTIRGRKAGSGGIEQYHAHQPAGVSTGTTNTVQHGLTFNPTTRYPQPGNDTRTDRSGPVLSAATTRAHGTKTATTAEDRFWLRTDSVADFDLEYDYEVGVRSELVADWPPNVLGGMVQGWFLPSAGAPEDSSGVTGWISRTLGGRPSRSAVVPARVTLRFTGSEAAEGQEVDPPLPPEVSETPPVLKGDRFVPTGPAPVFEFNAWPELTSALNTVAPGQDRHWRSLDTSTSAESTAVRIGELIQAGEIGLDHPRTAAGLTDSMPGAYPFESAPDTPPSLSVTLHNPRRVTEASDVTLDRLGFSSTVGGSSSNLGVTGGISFQGIYSHDNANQASGGATIPVLARQPRTTGGAAGTSGGRREWLKTGGASAPKDGSHGTRSYEALVDTHVTVRGPEGTRHVTGTATVRVAERDVLGHGITPPRTHPQVYDLASMVRAGADLSVSTAGAAADLRDWRTHPLDSLPDLLASQIDPVDQEAQLWLAVGTDPATGDGNPARPDPRELGRALFAASQTAATAGKPVELVVRYEDGTLGLWNFDSEGRPSGLDPDAMAAWQGFHTEASVLTSAAREEQESRREEFELREALEQQAEVLADALREVDLALAETRPASTGSGPLTRPRMRLDRTPRFTVPSRFDVRRIRHDDETVADLTITVAFNGGNSETAWNKLRQGVEEYYNAPGHRLPNGDLLHITVEPAPPGTTPHLSVGLVGPDTVMDQQNWHHDANPVDYAHELGHQLGLRDEYQDDTAPHRPDIQGSLLGNHHQPSPDALPQAHLRQRHLELLATLIGDTDIHHGNGDWARSRDSATPAARSHTWIDPVSQPLGPENDDTSRPDTDTVAARMLPMPRGLRQDSDDSDAADSDESDWDAPAPTVTTSRHTTVFAPPPAAPTPVYVAPAPAQIDDQSGLGGTQHVQDSRRSASPPAPTALPPDALPTGPFTAATLWSNAPALPDFSVITLGNGKTYPMVYPGDRAISQWADPYEGVDAYDQMLLTSNQYLSLIVQRAEGIVAEANASGAERKAAGRLLETNSLLEADGWLPEYRSEFLRMQMLLGEGDLLDGLPARLASDAGIGPVWALTDPANDAPAAQRPVGGSLRGEDGVSSRFHAWVNDNGGDSDWLADWSLGQSGGSIHSSSQYFKVMVSHFRPPRDSEGYHMSRLDEQSRLVRSDSWQNEHGREFPVTAFTPTYVRSMAAQHAFTYEVLQRVQIPNVDAARGVVQLIRLEERSLLGQYNEPMPPVGGQVQMKRGPAESYSLLEPYKDPTDTDSHMLGPFWVTSQEVPLHRVFGTYLQSRAVPKEEKWSEHTLFLREDENEFLALGEGAPITYHGTNTPPVLPATPTPPRTVSARAPQPGTRTVGQSPPRDTAAASTDEPPSTDEPSSTDEPLSEKEIAARTRLRAAESALEAAGLHADDLQHRIDTAADPQEEASLRAERDRHTAVLSDAVHEVDLALAETRPASTGSGPLTRPRMRLDRTPRFTVPSRFDVRRIRHDDETVADLTITVAFNGGNSETAWNKLRQGVEEYYNAPGHRLPNGDLLHITVEPAPPGTTPHLSVGLVGPDTVMDQQNWHHDANPVDYAHELGHQLGLRDEYQDDTAPHRPDIQGSLLGNHHQPSPDALPQAHLRQRHLELLATLIGDTDIHHGNGDWARSRDSATPAARSHTWIDPVSQPLGPQGDDGTAQQETDTVAARMLPMPRGLRQDSDDSDAADSDESDWDAPAPTPAGPSAAPRFTWVQPPVSAPSPVRTPPSPEPAQDDQTEQSTPFDASSLVTYVLPDSLPQGPFNAETLWSLAPPMESFAVVTDTRRGLTVPLKYPDDRPTATWSDPWDGNDAFNAVMEPADKYLDLVIERAEHTQADEQAPRSERDAAERLLKTNTLLKDDNWRPEYRVEFLRVQMLLGEHGMLDRLPRELVSNPDWQRQKGIQDPEDTPWALVEPTETTGPIGGSLRGTGGVSTEFHTWLNGAGGSSGWLNAWADEQAGGSINTEPQRFKVMISHFRPPKPGGAYYMAGLNTSLRHDTWEWDGQEYPVTRFDPENLDDHTTYLRSMIAQHVFTYEVLTRVKMPNVDPTEGVVQLIRLEKRSLLEDQNSGPMTIGDNVHMTRGPAESYSLLTPYKDPTDESSHTLGPFWVTSQKVPLHHVFGTYLQSRADTTPDRSLLLGEGENEFLALGEGAPITYHGTHTPPVLPTTPTPPRTVSARAPQPGQKSGGQRQSAASGSGSQGSSSRGRTTLDEQIRTAQRLSRAAEAEAAHIGRNRPAERQGARPDEIRAREARRTLEQLRRARESVGSDPVGTEPAATDPASNESTGDGSQQNDLAKAARARRYAAEKALEEAGRRADELRELLDAARERQVVAARAQRGAAERLAGLAADVNSLRGAEQVDMPTGSLARTPSQWPDPGSRPNLARELGGNEVRGGGRTVTLSPEESFSASLLRELSPESAPAQDGGGRDALNLWLSERISALEAESGAPVTGLPSGDDTADLDEITALDVALGPGQLAEASMLGGRITLSAAQFDIGQRIRLLVNRAGPGSYPETLAALTAMVSGRSVVIVDRDGTERSQGTGTGEPIRIVFDGVRYSTPPRPARET